MKKNRFLIGAAICSATAALLHLGCIVFGGSWYRFFGAGEQMAQMADAGLIYPTLVTAVIVTMLLVWSLYALSGAGLIKKLPLLRTALCLIAGLYLVRGLAFFLLKPVFPDNSALFWYVSSTICLAFGLIYALGIKQSWAYLSPKIT